jgi:hypothetical protein
MPASNDLIATQLSTVQSAIQPKPNTIASAATVGPTSFITFISGTVAIATITPPADGQHMLVFIFTTTTPVAFTTTGNVKRVSTPVQNVPVVLLWNPNESKYYPGNWAA